MRQPAKKSPAKKPTALMVPADLAAADARDLRKTVLTKMKSRKKSHVIELGSETPDASVSALQLLIAATRPTGPTPATLGPRAQAAVAALTVPRTWSEPLT